MLCADTTDRSGNTGPTRTSGQHRRASCCGASAPVRGADRTAFGPRIPTGPAFQQGPLVSMV
jgi:hypothetical protein